jgi:serine/threonine-protein kinase
VNPALESVVMAALAKDPAQRWQTADDFAEALQAAGAQLGASSPSTAAFAPIVTPPPPPPEKPAAAEQRRRRWPWFTIGLLTLALVGFLTYLAVAALTRADKVEVPRVVGKQQVQARQTLERAGFEVSESRVESHAPVDQVVDQDPNGGDKADKGSTVLLEVSGGPGTARVPSVAGLPTKVAINELEKQDLKATVEARTSDSVDKGLAIRTVPSAGTEVNKGERVTLFISSGPQQVAVPDVTGLSRDSAEAELVGAGLDPTIREQESKESKDQVISQSPSAGTKVDRGASVTITVSKGVPQVVVPNVVGLGAGDAAGQLRAEGLAPVQRKQNVTDSAEDGKVIDQRPAAGVQVDKGRTVVIIVGVLVKNDQVTPGAPGGSQQ